MSELWAKPAVRAAVIIVSVVLFLWLVYAARAALTPFVISFCLAYALDPVIDRMEALRINRTVAIVILLALGAVAVVCAVALVGPMIWSQVETLGKNLPRYVEFAEKKIEPLIEAAPQLDRDKVEKVIREGMGVLGDAPFKILKGITGWMWSSLTSVVGIIVAVFNLVIIPVATFYLLKDFDHIVEKIALRIPPGRRERVGEFFRKIDAVLSAFFRGQLVVALFMAVILSTGLLFIGTPMGLFIGIVAGMSSVVPYLSIVVGLAPALLLTYLQFSDWQHVAMVAALFAAAQAIEGFVISPKVLEKAVGLHPVAVMAALLAGGTFFGFIGVLLAVPTAAVLKVVIVELDEAYMRSDFYTGRGRGD